ncbi:MAG TPA: anthranilate phosphoribosyltransferase [Chitinophagaceae bacterium]|nr:anthranilate phosphoribosyltransferase [Chitinophagaceae bacterium]
MKKILQYLFEHQTLSRDTAREILVNISKGVYNESELAAFMTVFLMRSITVDELSGFREALLELCVRVDLDGTPVLDIVGTGGDGKNTFNISTLACFIAAGAGVPVAKHGNYGVTSVSGASNVMEAFGYRFKQDSGQLRKELESTGICFLHAPLFHPALKNVAPIRRQLGIRTFFNLLGPLVNPAFPAFQFIGVYSLELARVYHYIYQQTDRKYVILHSLDGYDEISLTGDARVITNLGERNCTPEELGKRSVHPEDIYGGQDAAQSAQIFLKILKGEGTWAQHAVALANAAMGIHCAGKFPAYEDCYQAAVESLESGSALKSFEGLMAMNK